MKHIVLEKLTQSALSIEPILCENNYGVNQVSQYLKIFEKCGKHLIIQFLEHFAGAYPGIGPNDFRT